MSHSVNARRWRIYSGTCAFPVIAERTISHFAATKVYNIPGVGCAAAVIPDEALRERFVAARRGLVHGIGPLGFAASEAAFNDRGPWISELNAYLRGNVALLSERLGDRLARLEATYLAWIDVSALRLNDAPAPSRQDEYVLWRALLLAAERPDAVRFGERLLDRARRDGDDAMARRLAAQLARLRR